MRSIGRRMCAVCSLMLFALVAFAAPLAAHADIDVALLVRSFCDVTPAEVR